MSACFQFVPEFELFFGDGGGGEMRNEKEGMKGKRNEEKAKIFAND